MLTNKTRNRLLNILLVLLLIMACISCNPKPAGTAEEAEAEEAEEEAKKAEDARPAEVVRIYEYDIDESVGFEDREETVTIKNSQGDELERYAKKFGLATHCEYEWSNPFIVSGSTSETYVDIGDGKLILTTKRAMHDLDGSVFSQWLCSPEGYFPEGISFIGEYSQNGDIFYSDLPSKVYRYDGEDLIEVESLPQSDLGSELGKVTDFNAIFSDDLTAIKAVLPRTSLSETVMKDELEINEIGFTLVSLEGEDNLLPYITGDLPDEGETSKRKTIVYSKVPEEFEEIFEQLIR
ncbi:hypothetical protein KAU08_05760 [bacterium]|nr:hypothetical protein [bacterium]